MAPIPTTPHITESALIPAPLARVWHLIKLPSFPHFWTALSKAEDVKGTSPETDIVRWTFKDGTKLEVKMEEHSVTTPPPPPFFPTSREGCQRSPPEAFSAWATMEAGEKAQAQAEGGIVGKPALSYTSAVSTVRCWPVTSGEKEGCTFVTWTGNFSGDADAGVIEDARYKRREALADLAAAVVQGK
ncbi:hypothetical protein MMC10_005998 [Thelotrema lepadinum]|nr:hypothetical protein [Thelotrema lepadinum]